ncbi:hypothetical protein [Streptomyces sp. Tu102]|uniref:hypothetical protein n=1 Tax=Streptomyces TaxID=1883 RepID=UPI001BDCF9E3|nr:hypothetical protein [Streptomyces sp. Tu102]MBT1093537.1 hypothetical protein [Streptomyces sp. Tu102]
MSWQSLLWSFLLHDVAGNVLGGLVLAVGIAFGRQARIAWRARRIPTRTQQISPSPTVQRPDHRDAPG